MSFPADVFPSWRERFVRLFRKQRPLTYEIHEQPQEMITIWQYQAEVDGVRYGAQYNHDEEARAHNKGLKITRFKQTVPAAKFRYVQPEVVQDGE